MTPTVKQLVDALVEAQTILKKLTDSHLKFFKESDFVMASGLVPKETLSRIDAALQDAKDV